MVSLLLFERQLTRCRFAVKTFWSILFLLFKKYEWMMKHENMRTVPTDRRRLLEAYNNVKGYNKDLYTYTMYYIHAFPKNLRITNILAHKVLTRGIYFLMKSLYFLLQLITIKSIPLKNNYNYSHVYNLNLTIFFPNNKKLLIVVWTKIWNAK